VRCNEKYCYGLKAVLRNNLYSQSADTCVTAITNTIPPAGVLTSTFTPGNQVELTFSIPGNLPATRITYQKSQENAPFATLTTSDKLNITDNNLNLATGSFCYQAFYEDACGKTAPVSNRTCPVILRATLGPNGTINLNWTNYQGFEPANTNYQVERLSENGTVISSTPVTGNSFTERVNATDQQLFYRIKVLTANPAVFSFSNTQLLRQESSFQIPTAFSPNGDNLNDRFEIKGKIFGTFRLSVFDRWGQEIFRSTNPAEGWDGNIRGRAAPVGVYVYSLTATDTTGKQIAKTGTVTLVR
jgi:gliding motility-associated-like protein